MGFLVGYSELGVPSWDRTAIYLYQPFYELIFDYCASDSTQTVLSSVASLGYGDMQVLLRADIRTLREELAWLPPALCASNAQFGELAVVLDAALRRKLELSVSGDMSRVLGRAQ